MELSGSHFSLFGICFLVTALSHSTSFADKPKALPNAKNSFQIPTQIHISIGSKPNSAYIMWALELDTDCYVNYGDDAGEIKISSDKINLVQHSSNALKFVYRAELENLEPGKRYFYTISCPSTKAKSQTISFGIPHNNQRKPHKFIVLADMGLITKSLQFIIHEILNTGYEIVFHVGDIAYNLDSYGGSLGDKFMNKISNFTACVPYMTTPGDHEKFFDFYHYRHRFSMPNSPWPMKTDSLFYSMDIGYTHFISINTDLSNASDIAAQVRWLKHDLLDANKNRKAVPWIIVMGHKPLYCTKSIMAQDCDKDDSPLREIFEDMFFEHGIDLYICGHKHSYERSWPLYKGKVFQTDYINPMAPIHIISGTLGYEYIVDKQHSKPYWLALGVSDGGKEMFARLTVTNATHLIWSMHAAETNEEVDNIQVIQNKHGKFGNAGPLAFKKVQLIDSKGNNLPPEPFVIVDSGADNQLRRVMLYTVVLILFLILVIFVRFTRFRKCCFGRR